jgi:hypothetical protein
MKLADVLEQGTVTMKKEGDKYIITFTGSYDYGIFSSKNFEADTLKGAYEQLVESFKLKST